jgi:hypothetical protein
MKWTIGIRAPPTAPAAIVTITRAAALRIRELAAERRLERLGDKVVELAEVARIAGASSAYTVKQRELKVGLAALRPFSGPSLCAKDSATRRQPISSRWSKPR